MAQARTYECWSLVSSKSRSRPSGDESFAGCTPHGRWQLCRYENSVYGGKVVANDEPAAIAGGVLEQAGRKAEP